MCEEGERTSEERHSTQLNNFLAEQGSHALKNEKQEQPHQRRGYELSAILGNSIVCEIRLMPVEPRDDVW
jgi:hypothetical protein